MRDWQRDQIAVTVQFKPTVTPVADEALSQKIAATLQSTSGNADVKYTPLGAPVLSGHTAVAFFTLSGNQTPNRCDSTVQQVVNSTNAQVAQPTNNGVVTIKPLPVSGTDVSIVGAAPNFTITGQSLGGDGDGGSPGGPPHLKSPQPGYGDVQVPNPLKSASPVTVVILDTGYAFGKDPQNPHTNQIPCPNEPSQVCAPVAKPISDNSIVASAINGTPFAELGRVVWESDMALPNDSVQPLSHTQGTTAITPLHVPYEMVDANGNPINETDHGLFIASQVHAVNPNAQIRIIRVLNDYGMGDLRSILIGLETLANHPDLLNIPPGSKVVVNMSLVYGPPAACLAGIWDSWNGLQGAEATVRAGEGDDPSKWSQYRIDCANGNAPGGDKLNQGDSSIATPKIAPLVLPLTLAVNELFQSAKVNVTKVVAAAGNDSKGATTPLDADLPAAMCTVQPVAAQAENNGSLARADFSNQPFIASSAGHSCLSVAQANAGDPITVSIQPQTSPNALPGAYAVGVDACGLFLQQVPPATAGGSSQIATNHVALWDGTSFATGFTSGFIAGGGTIPSGGQVPEYQPCSGSYTPTPTPALIP